MNRTSSGIDMLLVCLGLVVIVGCSNEPTPAPRFQIDPQKAAQEAMKLYDANGDGTLDKKELSASPPLLELLENLKTRPGGHPDSLTAADIATRFEEWVKAPANLFTISPTVYLDGAPLAGATVTYDPEPFLGSSYHPHQGKTDVHGGAGLEPEVKGFPGIYVGLYRVRISKKDPSGNETLPARYNTKTELGREVAAGIRNTRESVVFRLTSK